MDKELYFDIQECLRLRFRLRIEAVSTSTLFLNTKKILPLLFTLLLFNVCSCKQQDDSVFPGIYQTENYVPLLKDKSIAVVANHSSYIGKTHLIDTLFSLGIKVEKVFAPEHGFKGTADAGENIENTKTGNRNIEIVSLYGNNYKPKPEDLLGIEAVVFDLQDVGVRFFTYISTLHYVMEACAEQNIPVVLLDRPNPNAHYIDGPIREEKYKGMVAMHPVPIVYGLTIGEYAQMINGEGWLKDSLQCTLTVVAIKNYTHRTYYELPIAPSPNLPDMETVLIYPSTCLFEGTIMSEGRGTLLPFRVIGHPDFPDTTFSFVPHAIKGMSKYPKLKNEKCYGYDFRNISTDSLINRTKIDLSQLIDAYKKMNIGERFFISYFENLVGTKELRKALVKGKSEEEIYQSWQAGLDNYKKIRAKYLIYPD